MLLSLLLLAQAASPPPPGSLASYFTSADYPREAIKRREHGAVAFRVEVSRKGRVSRCTVTRSSGSLALDETTCRLATQRLRFRPATDSSGRPVADVKEGLTLIWRLPQ